MSDTALKLAELIERDYRDETLAPRMAAAELRRLHARNAELVEALRLISATFDDSWMEDSVERVMGDKACAALAKVEASK